MVSECSTNVILLIYSVLFHLWHWCVLLGDSDMCHENGVMLMRILLSKWMFNNKFSFLKVPIKNDQSIMWYTNRHKSYLLKLLFFFVISSNILPFMNISYLQVIVTLSNTLGILNKTLYSIPWLRLFSFYYPAEWYCILVNSS